MQDESSNTNDDAQGNSSLIIPPELSVRPDKSGVAGVALFFPLLFFLIRKIPLWKYVLSPVLSWLKATREGHIMLYSQKVGE